MKVYVARMDHYRFRYLMYWTSPDGYGFYQWFHTLKDLKEYISEWDATLVWL